MVSESGPSVLLGRTFDAAKSNHLARLWVGKKLLTGGVLRLATSKR